MKKLFAVVLLLSSLAFSQTTYTYSSLKWAWYNSTYEKTHATYAAFDSATAKLDMSSTNRLFFIYDGAGNINTMLDASVLGIYNQGGLTGFGTRSPIGVTHAVSASETYAPTSQRSGLTANSFFNTHKLLATKTSNMGDGFGPALSFYIEDDAAVKNKIALISAVRAGADNTGEIVLSPFSAGSSVNNLRFSATGKLSNVSGPDGFLDIRATEGLAGSFVLAADDGDDAADKWTQTISASTNNWTLSSNGRNFLSFDAADGEARFDVDVADIYRGVSIGETYAAAHGMTFAIARANGAYSCDVQYTAGFFAQSYGVYNDTTKLGNIGLYGESRTVDGFSFGCGGTDWWAEDSKFSVNKYGNTGIGQFARTRPPNARLEIDGYQTYDLVKIHTADSSATPLYIDYHGLVGIHTESPDTNAVMDIHGPVKLWEAIVDSVKYIGAGPDSVRFYFANGKNASVKLW
jgi:hypothetical protein